jgi:hypothetical protein
MKTAVLSIVAANVVPWAVPLAVKVGPWLIAILVGITFASWVLIQWFRVMSSVNASIARNIRP